MTWPLRKKLQQKNPQELKRKKERNRSIVVFDFLTKIFTFFYFLFLLSIKNYFYKELFYPNILIDNQIANNRFMIRIINIRNKTTVIINMSAYNDMINGHRLIV